ncbi:MAG: hypothetical protein LUC92_08685 [Clostridiales bacterium]|nr:hypothetical protein [Clostridiales bacterium]
MAVLEIDRKTAYTEFENTFDELYEHSRERTEKVSKRRQWWICRPIDDIMNAAFDTITELTAGYYKGRETEKNAIVKEAIRLLESLEKPLLIFWNVEQYEFRRMVNWVEIIRRELRLLNGLLPEEEKTEIKLYTVLDYSVINKMEFLSNMTKLHKYCYGKIIHADKAMKYTTSALLSRLIDEALYQVIKANRKIPTTKREYEIRKESISKAITSLRKMNRPMVAYFNIMGYSEQIMLEWSDMLVKEIRLLGALQRSDKQRFGTLE